TSMRSGSVRAEGPSLPGQRRSNVLKQTGRLPYLDSSSRLGVDLTTFFLRQQIIDRNPARAVNEDQRQQKQDQRGKLEVLPLLNQQHSGQPNIQDGAQQDWYLGKRRQPRQKSQRQQQPAHQVYGNHVMRHRALREGEVIRALQQPSQLLLMHQEVQAFDKQTDSQINANKIDDDVHVRFDPLFAFVDGFHAGPFVLIERSAASGNAGGGT